MRLDDLEEWHELETTTDMYVMLSRLPIRANDEDVAVHSHVFAISAASIKTHRASWKVLQEALDYRPWLGCCQSSFVTLYEWIKATHTLYLVEEK